jgi:hypothetical protein
LVVLALLVFAARQLWLLVFLRAFQWGSGFLGVAFWARLLVLELGRLLLALWLEELAEAPIQA